MQAFGRDMEVGAWLVYGMESGGSDKYCKSTGKWLGQAAGGDGKVGSSFQNWQAIKGYLAATIPLDLMIIFGFHAKHSDLSIFLLFSSYTPVLRFSFINSV